jgi:hypothetical protein
METERYYNNKTASILLAAAALVLMANGIYNLMQFSIRVGGGEEVLALLQSNPANVTVSALQQSTTSQLQSLYQAVLESYLSTGIGLAMFVMAFILLMHGPNRYESYLKRYLPLHITLILIYIILLLIIHFTFSSTFYSTDLYLTYFAIALCLILDTYLQFSLQKTTSGRKFGRSISIDPSTPYANIVALKEQLFDDLSGEICIVDKHFNSNAMSNLYRLIPSDRSNIKSLRILTSQGMLDSKFGSNYLDLKEEFKNTGVELEVKIMKDEDATVQHERFLFDDKGAYTIPPLNIINKKSEHINRMSMRDAKKRFDYLYQNSVKFENYSEKQARN